MKEAYCTNCHEKQPYRIKSAEVIAVHNGVHVLYREETAICSVCCEEMWLPEIKADNLVRLHNAYLKATENMV